MVSLRELQADFAAALRDPQRTCAVTPAANLDIYRHNADIAFRSALEIGFPVLRRRVGDDFFRQLVHHYRQAHPSRSGDLHWVGSRFADFLAAHLRDGDYAWLADLARLEWAREAASIAVEDEALHASALANYPPEALARLVFGLQPSLSLVQSAFPVFSVWFANQAENAPPVDQSLGNEAGMVRSRSERVEVSRVAPDVFALLERLRAGDALGDAVAAASLAESRLTAALGFVFESGLVSSLSLAGEPGQREGTSS